MAQRAKSGCLILFSLPFAAVGVWQTISAARGVLEYRQMQSWVEVPATIKRAELKVDRDNEGGTTYEAVADYEYQFKGQQFTGSRVGVHGGSDNLGSFHRQAYRELKQHLDQHKPFRCFVNPS